ncbi:hypothetical protein [Methylobacterium sp. V23]|uniref:hypothetical protein n=1 Tax=Methylobacterium sp. V23 TaxID=2044878 RepID=UPI000CDB5F43|nr:hypothetical protein [Methylobacterium sp. V23]POR42692.1 hypothetical protein CRT23_11195 [Methylobacterium sp. V23]
MSEPPRVTLTDEAPKVVRIPKAERLFVDAPEPGTYRDPFTGKLMRLRKRQGSEWWGTLLDRIHR